jgi:hypothetical protein
MLWRKTSISVITVNKGNNKITELRTILGMLIENKCNEKHNKFEDTKGVIRDCKLKNKRTNNDLQNTT